MSAVEYTKEQLAAIETRGCDLLVSAAAGSGKTAVLAERIVRLVSSGEADIDRILVVTFTRAAAASMREKIAKQLTERIVLNPADAGLRRQEMMLPHAKIMTIDAFCQYILRNNFDVIGLDPSFRICDEGEEKLLAAGVMEDLLEEAYAKGEEAFLACTEYFAPGDSDRQLEEEIRRLHRFSESMPWPALWLEGRRREALAGDAPEGAEPKWITDVIKKVQREIFCGIDMLKEALDIASAPGGPEAYHDIISNDIENLKRLTEAKDFETLRTAMQGPIFDKLPSKKGAEEDPNLRTQAKDIRDEVKDIIKKNNERYFNRSLEEAMAEQREADRAVAELLRLTLLYRERLFEKKRERNILNFSDAEHLALQILTEEPADETETSRPQPSATAREYADFFREIMIDEYQDSNYVQEAILSVIAGQRDEDRDRFMVGDVKQSIYRFRLARPEIFMDKVHRYPSGDEAQGPERRIDLHHNFRSRPEVLRFVNETFSQIMAADVGGVDYDGDAALQTGKTDHVADASGLFDPEVLLVCQQADGDHGDAVPEPNGPEPNGTEADGRPEGEALSREQEEARAVGLRIRELLTDGRVQDGQGGVRAVHYRDIVILLRTASGIDEIYREELSAQGIPVYIESKSGYFQAPEVRALLDLLLVLENPLRDIPLAAVLKSAIAGFSDEELAEIRLCDNARGHAFYEALCACGKEEGKDLSGRVRGFLSSYAAWREAAARLSVGELLDQILSDTGYQEITAAMPGGERRRANVQLLRVRAAEFEKNGGRGLSAFCERMEQFRQMNVDYGEAASLSEEADVVRIMSIHKSKGLEFPVVFVSGLSRGFNRMDEKVQILTEVGAGIGALYVDTAQRIRKSTLKRFAIADRMRLESLGEEYRILYVAMTRAMDKLILTASVPEDTAAAFAERRDIALHTAHKAGQELLPPLPYLKRSRAGSFFDVLEHALPQVRMPFTLRVLDRKALEDAVMQAAEDGQEETAEYNIDRYLKEEIQKKFSYRYPFESLQSLFIKTTVTEWKERILEEEGEAYVTNRLIESKNETAQVGFPAENEGKMSGAERGTTYHKVMELLDAEILDSDEMFKEDLTENFAAVFTSWMRRLEKEGRLFAGASEIVRPADVWCFLKSPLGERFIHAWKNGALRREKQFMMSVDARRIRPEMPEGETVLLQGVVDAWFTEDDEIILVDYKTDRVTGDGSALVERYGIQLTLYEEAMTRLTGLPVREKWLWSFTLGRAVPVK